MENLRPGILSLLLAGASVASAQGSGTCAEPFSASMRAGVTLTIESRSGEIDVVGSDKDGLSVTCKLEDLDRAKDVRIEFEQTGDFGRLAVRGGFVHNFKVRIEVPRKTGLRLRVPAGEVRVNEVFGDKDISLGAGEITVSNVTASEYRSVKASVDVGAVSASAFGVGKGGFFRTFEKEIPGGQFRLCAHLTSGNIQLN
jgi:hypothetical protein